MRGRAFRALPWPQRSSASTECTERGAPSPPHTPSARRETVPPPSSLALHCQSRHRRFVCG
ncbi:hypothetical protein C8Q79DRAFT_982224 [Trametes meyenii]|nr:hypothetical protein C8Q79DRAFT_982224 [Trametes meyenii]